MPGVYIHEHAGQSRRCLQGLVEQAKRLAKTPRMQQTSSVGEVVQWIRSQPYLPDEDATKAGRDGCDPHQRGRFWPDDGLNCWEATLHYAAAVYRHGLPAGYELHIYDVDAQRPTQIGPKTVIARGARHVFPRLKGPDGTEQLVDLETTIPRSGQRGSTLLANDQYGDAATGVDAGAAVLSGIVGIFAGQQAGAALFKGAQLGTGELRKKGQEAEDSETEDDEKPRRKTKKKQKKRKGRR